MRTLSAAELLNIWETGRELPPLDRATLLLLMVFPGTSWEAVESWSLGRRESALIQLRETVFGPAMDSVTNCPSCGERLSFTLSGPELGAGSYPEAPEAVRVQTDGYELSVRLPTAADIRATAGDGRRLFGHLLLEAREGDRSIEAIDLPPEVIDAAAEAVRTNDPLAEVTLSLSCPACGHQWTAPFDIISFFWREIEAWAVRTLRTVHALASRYGWSEEAILAMSAWRRQHYLEMDRA